LNVFVLDTNKKPQNPVHPAKARLLLSEEKAAVFRQYPFTIILKEEIGVNPQALRVKIDPGSKTSGIAVTDDATGEIVFAMAKAPLKDAAAVNSTRWDLFRTLKETGLPVEIGSGGLTKFNRTIRGLSKTHWLDAACVGKSTLEKLFQTDKAVLIIKANGHGSRQMCRVNTLGFPRTKAKSRKKKVNGFQTGDIAKAIVTSGKKVGTYIGRVAVRKSGFFNIKTRETTIQGINWTYCHMLHMSDGYSYNI